MVRFLAPAQLCDGGMVWSDIGVSPFRSPVMLGPCGTDSRCVRLTALLTGPKGGGIKTDPPSLALVSYRTARYQPVVCKTSELHRLPLASQGL